MPNRNRYALGRRGFFAVLFGAPLASKIPLTKVEKVLNGGGIGGFKPSNLLSGYYGYRIPIQFYKEAQFAKFDPSDGSIGRGAVKVFTRADRDRLLADHIKALSSLNVK